MEEQRRQGKKKKEDTLLGPTDMCVGTLGVRTLSISLGIGRDVA